MPAEIYKYKSSGSHQGYRYSILKSGGMGQDSFVAMAESLSIKTTPFANPSLAEECIKDLIDRTYDATFKKSKTQIHKDEHAAAAQAKHVEQSSGKK